MLRIFISSVQKELADERAALREYLHGDALLRRFFEPFLFEDLPAADQRPDECYLEEVQRCDIYLGIFGKEYGREDSEGFSATHREFDRATELGKCRLLYVKGAGNADRHPKMAGLIQQAGSELIRKRFSSAEELVAGVYASLVRLLEERELIRFSPFDATFCRNAALEDLDDEKITRFLGLARRGRSFPLPEETPPLEVLTHLNLLDKGRPTHAAILLFGKQPQRFLINSEVRCAHFHGFEVEKPIPSYQVYKGTVFDLVDQAKDFVLSKIDLWTGDRSQGVQVPTAYEIPQEVVAEAIVNAVCHRDYTGNASVQVMLFKDRLEIWNPGSLPPSLTLEKLRGPHASVPANPLIAEPLYLTKYIERMGTGIRDMIDRCNAAGLPEPEIRIDSGSWITVIRRKTEQAGQVTAQVTPQDKILHENILHDLAGALGVPAAQVTAQVAAQVTLILDATAGGDKSREELQEAAGISHREHFRKAYIEPLLSAGWIERTIPDKATSRFQKYRLTQKGRDWLAAQGGQP
jgi:ATP-dependent DNA helicase RecG